MTWKWIGMILSFVLIFTLGCGAPSVVCHHIVSCLLNSMTCSSSDGICALWVAISSCRIRIIVYYQLFRLLFCFCFQPSLFFAWWTFCCSTWLLPTFWTCFFASGATLLGSSWLSTFLVCFLLVTLESLQFSILGVWGRHRQIQQQQDFCTWTTGFLILSW